MTTVTPTAVRQLGAALRTFLALTVILGLAYPLTMTGVAQVLFPDPDGPHTTTRHGMGRRRSMVGCSS